MAAPEDGKVAITQEEYDKLQKLQARNVTSTKYNEKRRKALAVLQKRHGPEFTTIMADLEKGKKVDGVGVKV